MSRQSFLDCPHKNVQQFTETCLDCGYNIYMKEEEYLAALEEEVRRHRKDKVIRKIRKLERRLREE